MADGDTQREMMSKELKILVLFACGYAISYVYRGLNIGFAPFMAHDIGLSATDLGLLTSLYFLGFAGAQLPAGVMLDHFGSRRVTAALLLLAAAGATLFGLAHDFAALLLGRLLIGVGVSVCLGGAFKAIAQWYPTHRLPLANGVVLAVGGLGGVAVGAPLSWLLDLFDWRSICLGLAGLTAATSALIWLGAPEAAVTHRGDSLRQQLGGIRDVLRSGMFWKIASLSATSQAVFYTMQSLWMAPYLHDVSGFSAARAASIVSVVGLAMMVGSVAFGAIARAFERYGFSVYAFAGVGMALFIVVQGLIMARVPMPAMLLWAAYGMVGGTGVLSYAVFPKYFSSHLLGRVNTSMTLVIFLLTFALQIGVGVMLNRWPTHTAMDGVHFAPDAYLAVWGLLVGLQAVAGVWYVWY